MGKILDPNGKPVTGTLVNVDDGSVLIVFKPDGQTELLLPQQDPQAMASPTTLRAIAIMTLLEAGDPEFEELIVEKVVTLFKENDPDQASDDNDKR